MEIIRSRSRVSEVYGIIMTLGLILYFFIAYFGGFIRILEMRFLNFPIILGSIYLALRQIKKRDRGRLAYFWAIVVGIVSTAIGISLFSIFLLVIFMTDHQLFQAVVMQNSLGQYLTEYSAPMAVWTEGILSGIAASYILANVMHTDR